LKTAQAWQAVALAKAWHRAQGTEHRGRSREQRAESRQILTE